MASKFPDSPYEHDVPRQLVGDYRGYYFRVRPVQADENYRGDPEGVYVKEVWDTRNRFYWQGHTEGKAKAVQEIKDQVDVYIEEEGEPAPVGFIEGLMTGPTWWAANPGDPNVAALKSWSQTYFEEAGVGLTTDEIAEEYNLTDAQARRLARKAGLAPALYVKGGETLVAGDPGWPRKGHKPGWTAVWEPVKETNTRKLKARLMR